MKIVGITGGIGSGKSRILSFLEEQGAVICNADHMAWELQKPGEICYQDIVRYFGACILNADNTINREKLGEIVFGNEKELLALNEMMHPSVKVAIRECIKRASEEGKELFVLEAALLIEGNYNEICDELWYIYSSEPVRRQRLKDTRNYSDIKIDQIMKAQLSDEMFRKFCHRMIDNDGEFSKTCSQIEEALKQLGDN